MKLRRIITIYILSMAIAISTYYGGALVKSINNDIVLRNPNYMQIMISEEQISNFAGVYSGSVSKNNQWFIDRYNISVIYDYYPLFFAGYADYYDNSICDKTEIIINNQKRTIYANINDNPYVILPYFQEDGLDNDMGKIIVSKKLSEKIDCGVGDSIGIDTLKIPVAGEKIEDSSYFAIQSKIGKITLKCDEIIDYYSDEMKTENVILLPYTMIDELLKEYNSEYNAGIKVIYSKWSKANELVESLKHDCFDLSSQDYLLYNYYQTFKLSMYKTLAIAFVLFLIGIVLLYTDKINKYSIMDIGVLALNSIIFIYLFAKIGSATNAMWNVIYGNENIINLSSSIILIISVIIISLLEMAKK